MGAPKKASRKGGRPSSIHPGDRYGILTAVESFRDDSTPNIVWLMRCDCGYEIFATATHLRTLTHCGCQSKRWQAGTLGYQNHTIGKGKPNYRTGYNQIYANYRNSASKRGYGFDLTFDEFFELALLPCHYCGAEPDNILLYRGVEILYNGIDRKDSSQGYTAVNVVPCCGVCNEAKMDRPYNEFIAWVHRVHHHLTKGENSGRVED